MANTFSRFTILPDGDRYRLVLAMDDGTTVEVQTSFEQLDELAEEIDRRLDADETVISNPSDR